MTTADTAPATVELDTPDPPSLSAIPAPAQDTPAPRKSRSGTSGAERRRRAAAASGTPPKRDRQPAAPKIPPLDKRLTEAIALVGTLVGTFVDPYDGAVLTHNADKAGKVLSGIAARRPAFARLLNNLLAAGDNVDGIALLAGMLLPILCNHGVLPAKYAIVATVMGTAPPQPDADAAALRDMMSAFTAGPTEAAA